ncbi:polymerase delta-interacting protein 3-like [Sipha flava]|uniref:Polymerase delta-interacting protein 3-like n=1 Tax=Sipha flava TaxID=143950 RepID=A0A8B8FSE1_9HEMI|nr:polymerase delta-interacting protein 3-like [Sipha flava]
MKFIKGKPLQNGGDRGGRTKVLQSGPHNRLRLAAANKAAKVKRLITAQRQYRYGTLNKRKMLTKNTRVTINNVMDARIRLLQKALEKPTVMVDARQKLTKQKDARERIQERRLRSSSHDVTHSMGTSRGLSNNLGRVKIDRRGILTDKSIWDERDSSYHSSVRDQRPTVNQGHFYGVEKRRSRTFNSKLNIFRSDRPIEEIRPIRRDMRISRRPTSNAQSMRQPFEFSTRSSIINEKPYSRSMAMDYEDSMDWGETSRYSPTQVMRRNIGGNAMFNRDGYDFDLLDRNLRNHRGLSETLRSRLDSRQTTMAKRSHPSGHKIVISNLEPSVTSEDIIELFSDVGKLLQSRVIRPGVAEVIYERRADAIQAVDKYHNRKLDGKPMKCDMVRNVGSNPAGPISLPGTSHRMSSCDIDMYKPSAYINYNIDTVHTTLFNK